MQLRDPSRVRILECHLLNDYENLHKKHKEVPIFLWPKPAQGHETNQVDLTTVTNVVNFLCLFDAVMNSNSEFQQEWAPYGLKKFYGSSERGKDGNNNTSYYYEVCSFLLGLNDINVPIIFNQIQKKFAHDPAVKNIIYDDFLKVFAFLTYINIFLNQWQLNLFKAFSVKFIFNKFNNDPDSDSNNISFSNEDCRDIKDVCQWYIPVYFRLITMNPCTLEKLIVIYNLHKNKSPLCIHKNMYGDKPKRKDAPSNSLSDIQKIRLEIISRLYSITQDRGDDFDPNADQGYPPEYFETEIDDYFKKNMDNNQKTTKLHPKMRIKAVTSNKSRHTKKSKLEELEEKNPELFNEHIETAVALAGINGGSTYLD